MCARDNSCVSVNYKKSGEDQGRCELNNKLLSDSKENAFDNEEFDNIGIIERVSLYQQNNHQNSHFTLLCTIPISLVNAGTYSGGLNHQPRLYAYCFLTLLCTCCL